MKTIRKITNKVTDNFSAIAGSALLVGATLTGGAAYAAAQDGGSSGNSMDLADLPQPFVTEDGQVETSIVLGSDAKVTDVVGATEIAGALGNAAFKQETENVAVSGSGGSWSATNGVTLDTQNDDVYFGQNVNAVRETLTEGDLDILADATFTDDSNTDYDITHNLNVGDLGVEFSKNGDELDNEDPELNIQIPTESSVAPDNYVLNLQASIDSLDLEDGDVAGEDIELFGQKYTIASDHSDESNTDREFIKLYGSTDTVTLETGESTTVTVNGEEHTIEAVSVDSGNDEVSLRVDGNLEREALDGEFSLGDETVRVEEIVNVGATDDGQGVVELGIGSEELRLYNGEPVQDSDEEDYEGTYVQINGGDWVNTGTEVSSIDVYVGGDNDDEDALVAGETFSHPLFDQAELQFGGLNPDAAEEGSEVTFSNSGDDTATVDFTDDSDNDASVGFVYNDADTVDSNDDNVLADSDGDSIVVAEDRYAVEDDYIVTDAGDFAHMWEVTDINVDGADTTVDIEDAITGQSVELEADQTDDDTARYGGTEIIDGQEVVFAVSEDGTASNNAGEPAVEMSWGDGAYLDTQSDKDLTTNTGGGGSGDASASGAPDYYYDDSSGNIPGETTLYPALDTESGSAVAFTEPVDFGGWDLGNPEVFELPSTESTDSQRAEVETGDSSSDLTVTVDGTDVTTSPEGDSTNPGAISGATDVVEAKVGGVVYDFHVNDDGNLEGVALDSDQELDSDQDGSVDSPAAVVMQPEDDDDNENAYIVEPGVDSSDEEMDIGAKANIVYTAGDYSPVALESDEDVKVDYNTYGTYTEQDTDDQGDFTLGIPAGQSVVGAAVTGADGSLSAEGGGSGSVQVSSPTYQFADGVLADDGNVGQVKDNENVILVGGPAANSLTQELVEDGQTMPASNYTEGQGVIQMVDGFSEGNSALVVAGQTGEDTRAAAEFLADYRNNQDALEGKSEVTVETSSGTVVE